MKNTVAERIFKAAHHRIKPISLLWKWFAAFAGVFVAIGVLLIVSVYHSLRSGSINIVLVLIVLLFAFLFGYGVIRMLLRGFVRELRTLIAGMDNLYTQPFSMQQVIPITSRDETGKLAEAFNRLHSQIEQEYAEIRRDLQLAYEVQRHLLPASLHEIGEYTILCHSVPAQEVGGDLCDVLQLENNSIIFMIGDVSGKGMPAALVMSTTISLFRLEARRGGSVGEIMTRMNAQLSETLQGKVMVTLGIGMMEMESGTISYCSAGHIAPYILSKNILQRLMVGSLPLGFDAGETYIEQQMQLQQGDCLVLITDGVIELMDAQGEMFGFERFEDALMNTKDLEFPRERLVAIQERLLLYQGIERVRGSGYDMRGDDWTMVFVQRASSCGGRDG